MAVHTMTDLYQMQSLPLELKVRMTETRIRAWKKEKSFVYDNYSLFAKVKTESERGNLNIKL